jgi:glycosyltransferase involved in cell wall biosynthesis
MHILILTLYAHPIGGLEIYNYQVAASLNRLGHQVEVVSIMEWEVPQWEGISVKGLALPFLGRWYKQQRWRILRLYLMTHGGYDHVFVMHPSIAKAVHQTGIRGYWVWTYGMDVWGKWSDALHSGLAGAGRILSISDFTRQRVLDKLPDRQIDLVFPAIDVLYFTPTLYKPQPPRKILTVGRLASQDRNKGHDRIIRNLKAIRRCEEVVYWIVGDGNDRPRLEALAQAEGVAEWVDFKGRVSKAELLQFYQTCDIFVMTSPVEQVSDGKWVGEGFGIVYLEAAACGKPVIGSNMGGATEAILDKETGFCIDPFSDTVLVEVICELLQNPMQAQRMGEQGRKRVEREFSLQALDRRLQKLIEG